MKMHWKFCHTPHIEPRIESGIMQYLHELHIIQTFSEGSSQMLRTWYVLLSPQNGWQLFVKVSPSFWRAWSSISITWKWRCKQESVWTDRALCPRSLILRAVVKEWCSEVFYHSNEVICLKCGQPKTRCCCATGVFNHVPSCILLWWFPPIILCQFHSMSYLSFFCKEGSAEGLSFQRYFEGLEIVLQEFPKSEFQKCFR